MKVYIETSGLNEPRSWHALDGIIELFLEGRHHWDMDAPDNILSSQWITSDATGRAGRRNIEAIKKLFTRDVYPHSSCNIHTIKITISDQTRNESVLSAQDAKKALETPAFIVVENEASDGAFLRAILRAWDNNFLEYALDEGWLQLHHLGGFGEVEKRCESARSKTTGPLRVMVLADSDRLNNAHISGTIKKVKGYCDAANVPYHILSKRKIENYIPINLLQKLPRKYKKIILGYLALNQEQRDYFEMKKGFKLVGNEVCIQKEQEELFSGVAPSVLKKLCGGFGEDVAQLFSDHINDVKKENLTMICPADQDELKRLIDTIEKIM